MRIPNPTSTNPELEAQLRETPVGMAHWAGTGPVGKTCGDCVFWRDIGEGTKLKKNRCRKFTQLTNGTIGPRPLPHKTRSCKYWEAKQYAVVR